MCEDMCVHMYSYSFIPRSSVRREERLVSTVCAGAVPQVFVGNLETVAILVRHVVRLKHGNRLYLHVSYTLDKVSILVTEFLYTCTYNKEVVGVAIICPEVIGLCSLLFSTVG